MMVLREIQLSLSNFQGHKVCFHWILELGDSVKSDCWRQKVSHVPYSFLTQAAPYGWKSIQQKHGLKIIGWCFQTFFIFTPTWGNDPIWLIFFQMGWNHQPEKYVHELHHPCDFAYILGLNFESFWGIRGIWYVIFLGWRCPCWHQYLEVLNDTMGGDGWLRMHHHHRDDATCFFGSGVPKAKLFTCHWNANGSGHIRILKWYL